MSCVFSRPSFCWPPPKAQLKLLIITIVNYSNCYYCCSYTTKMTFFQILFLLKGSVAISQSLSCLSLSLSLSLATCAVYVSHPFFIVLPDVWQGTPLGDLRSQMFWWWNVHTHTHAQTHRHTHTACRQVHLDGRAAPVSAGQQQSIWAVKLLKPPWLKTQPESSPTNPGAKSSSC